MRRMRMGLLAIALFAGVISVHARGRDPGWGRCPGDPGAVFAQLDLTEAQQTQIAELRKQMREDMSALRASDTRPDPAAMQAMREAQHDKMVAVLTQEQREKLAAMEAECGGPPPWAHRGGKGQASMGRRGHGMWGGCEGCPPPEAMARFMGRCKPAGMGPMAGPPGGMWAPPGMGPCPPGVPCDHPGRDPMRMHGRNPNPLAQLDLSEEQKAKLRELHAKHRQAREALRAKHREEMEAVLTKAQRKQLELLKDEAFYGGGAGPRPGKGWRPR